MALSAAAKKIKKTWLGALRSGKYKQTTNVLYDPHTKGFCCLGVLEHKLLRGKVECEVDKATGKPIKDEPRGYPSVEFYHKFPGTAWIENNESKLVELNDHRGKSFKEIADYIQKKWR